MFEPYNAISMSRTNRIQNDVAEILVQHAGREKPRPTLNFHTTDDTIHYDARMEHELNVDSQEMETIDRNAHDESEASANGDTNHTKECNQETEVGPESYASEDYATFDSQVIDDIAEGFTHLHVFSLEDEEEESTSASECEWEWEITSGVQSVQSYRENECMFTYKDAVQVQIQTNRRTNRNPPSTVSFLKVNTFHKTTAIKSPPLARTFPTTTTKVLEEKEDGDNVEFDGYFEYDAYKGGRGGKSFKMQKRKSCITHTKRWHIESRYGVCKRSRGGIPFRW
uniref:Uncharacterized protein n=1 Tax=Chaetoceros debilis TaxID=122233 RepID=A0A7S3PW66_9STRA